MVVATIILGGVAIFTAIRLYQLRNQPVAPTIPKSEPAAANEGVIIAIPINTKVSGSGQHVLATKDVSQYSGLSCTVSAIAKNQSSVHLGNDIVVSSDNSDSVTLEDVEREAGVSTNAEEELILGNLVTVTLNMGPDNSFSAGMEVSLDCKEPPPPPQIQACTELAFSLSTSTATPTVAPTTTPTASPTATPSPTPTSTATATPTVTSTSTASPTATPAALPAAGVSTPTILGIGLGAFLLLGSLLLAI